VRMRGVVSRIQLEWWPQAELFPSCARPLKASRS
jgi:hypothetical protein